MFSNYISTVETDLSSPVYLDMVSQVEKNFSFISSPNRGQISSVTENLKLDEITQDFYREKFQNLYKNYVPLDHAIWKQRLKDVLNVKDTIHQDTVIHLFSKNGYKSRMINVWTNIYKDKINGLSESDMGIYVLDNQDKNNADLYEKLEKEDTHFYSKRDNELVDNNYFGEVVVKYCANKVKRKYFNFTEGVSVLFNSHLLHGTKVLDVKSSRFSSEDLAKFRVSLATNWIHKDDLDMESVFLDDKDNESLYLRKYEKELWGEIRTHFSGVCEFRNAAITNIKKLIRMHL